MTRYEVSGDVAELIISNPPLNLWNGELISAVEDGVARAAAERPRALIVRAEGDVFSAGIDVHVFEGLDAQAAAVLTERLLRLTHAVEDLPLPTLAVAHGLCLTAGLELALACDLLWPGAGVQFGLVEKVVGPRARVRDDRPLYAAETLHAWGVVNRVVESAQLLEQARRFAADLAAGPTIAHAATKAVVRAQADHGTRGADERTAALTSHLFETEDCRNAVQSFLREGPGKATFTGNLTRSKP